MAVENRETSTKKKKTREQIDYTHWMKMKETVASQKSNDAIKSKARHAAEKKSLHMEAASTSNERARVPFNSSSLAIMKSPRQSRE